MKWRIMYIDLNEHLLSEYRLSLSNAIRKYQNQFDLIIHVTGSMYNNKLYCQSCSVCFVFELTIFKCFQKEKRYEFGDNI